MSLDYAQDFRWFNDSTFGTSYFPSFAGGVGIDKFGQAWVTRQDTSGGIGVNYLLNADDGSVIWSISESNFRDQFILPAYPSSNVALGRWIWYLLQGGEYLLVCLDTVETRTYYALMQVNEGAPPTLINVYYVEGWQRYRFGGAYLANEQTYDDPIVIAYEFDLSTRWFYDILPSVNELINNNISNWTSDTSFPYASGELPKMWGASPPIDGRITDVVIGRLPSVVANTARCQFFATPQAETFLNVYIDRSKMTFQSNAPSLINAWIRDIVAPVHDQAIISVPFGRITAADYRPQGAFRTRTFTLAPTFVNETLLPSLPDEGTRALTNPAVNTNRVSIIPVSYTHLTLPTIYSV